MLAVSSSRAYVQETRAYLVIHFTEYRTIIASHTHLGTAKPVVWQLAPFGPDNRRIITVFTPGEWSIAKLCAVAAAAFLFNGLVNYLYIDAPICHRRCSFAFGALLPEAVYVGLLGDGDTAPAGGDNRVITRLSVQLG